MNSTIIPNEDERLKILKMVGEGKISASEGADLLSALGQERRVVPSAQRPRRDTGWFRVRVTDLVSGRPKATVNIPMGLMDWGLKIGAQFAPEVADVDLEELRETLRSGVDEPDGVGQCQLTFEVTERQGQISSGRGRSADIGLHALRKLAFDSGLLLQPQHLQGHAPALHHATARSGRTRRGPTPSLRRTGRDLRGADPPS